MDARDAVFWVNSDTKEVVVLARGQQQKRESGWSDPIGSHSAEWKRLTDEQRIQWMLELAIELAVRGIPMKDILLEFGKVTQFRALGAESHMMCRALTTAFLGKTLEANSMSFEELLVHHR